MRTVDDTPDDDVDETERYSDQIEVTFDASAMDVPEDYAVATYVVEHNFTDNNMFTANAGTPVAVMDDQEPPQPTGKWMLSFLSPTDEAFQVQVVATAPLTAGPATETNIVITSAPVTVSAIDPTASGVTAERGVDEDDLETLDVAWTATTNVNSAHRVVIEVDHSGIGAKVWLIAPTSNAGSRIEVNGTTRDWVLTLPAAPDADAVDPPVSGWTYAVGGTAPDVPRADLLKALNVAVESLQGTEAADNPWTRSDEVTVPAKPNG